MLSNCCPFCGYELRHGACPCCAGRCVPEGYGGGGADDDLPDWLRDDPTSGDDLPDWMRDDPVGGEDALPGWMEATPAGTGPLPNWASGDGGAASSDDVDWLRDLDNAGQSSTLSAFTANPRELGLASDVPDFLEEITGVAPGEDLPDWLVEEVTPGAQSTQPPSAPAFELNLNTGALQMPPDWMESEVTTPPSAAQGDIPAWLQAGMRDDDDDIAAPAFGAVAGQVAGQAEDALELPDWLQGNSGTDDKLPQWVQPTAPPERPAPGTGPLDIPDWMQEVDESTPAMWTAPGQDAEPAWLQGGFGLESDTPAAPTPRAQPSTPLSGDESAPDWLRGGDFDALRSGARATQTGDLAMPDWLQEAEIQASAGLDYGQDEAQAIPDWMQHGGEDSFGPDAPNELSFIQSGSDYADELDRREGGISRFADVVLQDEETPPPDLWEVLEDNGVPVREPGFTGPAVDPAIDLYEEKAGPLAGMRGVIRAEPVISLYGQPGATVVASQASRTQQAMAEQLAALLQSELDDTEVKVKKRRTRQVPWARWVVVALLLAVVALPLFAPGVLTGAQVAFTPGTPGAAFLQQVAVVAPVERPVLVAIEYDPGNSGELTAPTRVLLQQLIGRGVRVATVSTRAAGVGLAERLLNDVLPPVPTALPDGVEPDPNAPPPTPAFSQAVNLGYIPGGPLGIPAFVTQMNVTRGVSFFQNSLNDPFAQPLPALAGGDNRLNDYGLIVVVAGTPDDLQLWVEQVAAQVDAPMVALTSAAVRPLALTYYQPGGQGPLVGVLAGIDDTTTYIAQAAPGELGSAQVRWEMHMLGALLSAGLLVVGVLVGLVTKLRRGELRLGVGAAVTQPSASAVARPAARPAQPATSGAAKPASSGKKPRKKAQRR